MRPCEANNAAPISRIMLFTKRICIISMVGSLKSAPSCRNATKIMAGNAIAPNVAARSFQLPRRKISQVIVAGIDRMRYSGFELTGLICYVGDENLIERQGGIIDYGGPNRFSGTPELQAVAVTDVGPLGAVAFEGPRTD